MALDELLETDSNSRRFYETLHPPVRAIVNQFSENIVTAEDLCAVANNAMTERLEEYQEIFDDGERQI